MERNDSILGGALLLTAANLLLRLISIAFQVFLSVRIGAAGLGLMQLISTIGVFAMLAGTAGVRVTAMYLAAEEFGHRRLSGVRAAMRACLQYGILVSAVSGAALFFLSDFFAQAWLRDLRAAPSLRVMGLLLPFSCLCGIMTGYYTACSRIRQLVGIEIAERLDLPAESVAGVPKLTVTGRRRALVENHCGLLEYSHECIVVDGGRVRVCIRGTNLQLVAMDSTALLISGTIACAEFA